MNLDNPWSLKACDSTRREPVRDGCAWLRHVAPGSSVCHNKTFLHDGMVAVAADPQGATFSVLALKP
jgi:TfoX/Sxy family transcriptional regulator of competence genes